MSRTAMTDADRAVRDYLAALDVAPVRRGRKRQPERIERRLSEIAETIPQVPAVRRLALIQERIDLESELIRLQSAPPDMSQLEARFVEAAAEYAESHRISPAAFREAGVPTAVLRRAGLR